MSPEPATKSSCLHVALMQALQLATALYPEIKRPGFVAHLAEYFRSRCRIRQGHGQQHKRKAYKTCYELPHWSRVERDDSVGFPLARRICARHLSKPRIERRFAGKQDLVAGGRRAEQRSVT